MRRELSVTCSLLLFITLLVSFPIAGLAKSQKSDDNVLKTPVDGSKIVAETTFKTIMNLASVYKLRVAYEAQTGGPANGTKESRSQITLFRGTLEEFLNDLLQDEPRYTWTYQDGVINIFPATRRDPRVAEILDMRIKEFQVGTSSGVLDAGNNICNTPEVSARLMKLGITPIHFYSNGDLERRSTKPPVTFRDKTVRELLNEWLRFNDGQVWTIGMWGADNKLLTIALR